MRVTETKVDGKTYIVGETDVASSPEETFKVITDYEHASEIFKNLSLCKVVEDGGSRKKVRQVVKPGYFPFTFDYTVLITENEPLGLSWVKISGAFEEFSGYWKIEQPRDVKPGTCSCKVSYAVHLNAGMLIPQWILKRSLRAYMPVVLGSLIEAMEKRKVGNKQFQ